MAAIPESRPIMAGIPEPHPVMSTTSRTTMSVPRHSRLASSVEDPQLVLVQAAGIPGVAMLTNNANSTLTSNADSMLTSHTPSQRTQVT